MKRFLKQQSNVLLNQNQELILCLHTKDINSHKITAEFENFDEEFENFSSFLEIYWKCFSGSQLCVQNVPVDTRADMLMSSVSPKLYQVIKYLVFAEIPSAQSLDKFMKILMKHLKSKPIIMTHSRHAISESQTAQNRENCYLISCLWATVINCVSDSNMLNIMLHHGLLVNYAIKQFWVD